MSTDQPSEFDAFTAFVDRRYGGDLNNMSLEDALADFRAYERDLARLKAHLQPAIDQADRGEAKPLDIDALLDRVHQRIEREKGG
ncbi:MAG: hypothetical protein KDA63_00280 [Planctomycetales bacterium]|nr:hypothetical protein [Planctomycetales bacterium]